MNHYFILKQTQPATARPWRIIETYSTSEGPRSRIVSRNYASEEEAVFDVALREQGFNGSDEDDSQPQLALESK